MTCISKDERTLRRKQDIRTAFGKSYINLPPEVYFTPMGLECGHSMSPYLQGSICSYVRSTSLATTRGVDGRSTGLRKLFHRPNPQCKRIYSPGHFTQLMDLLPPKADRAHPSIAGEDRASKGNDTPDSVTPRGYSQVSTLAYGLDELHVELFFYCIES